MQSCYYKESDQNTHTRRNREESLAREMSAEMFEMMMMCGGEAPAKSEKTQFDGAELRNVFVLSRHDE